MSLSSGIYTITNISSLNRACLPNDDDQANVICKIPYPTVTDAEKWILISSPSGRYTIKNMKYKYHAATDVNPKVSASVYGRPSEEWWRIEEVDSIRYGQDTYSILHNTNSNLAWTLQDGANDTPVDLQPFVNGRRSLWKILPYPPIQQREFPFVDKSALCLNSVHQAANAEYIAVQLNWALLPRNFVLQFPEPLLVVSHSEVIAEVLVQGEFKTTAGVLDATLRVKDTTAFTAFAATVLRDDDVQVSVHANKFRFYPVDSTDTVDRQYLYRLPWKKDLIFKGLQSFRDRVTLSNLKILRSSADIHGPYLLAVVTANIVNSSRFFCTASIIVGIYYNSSKIGTAQCKDMQLQPGDINKKEVEWEFRPLSPASQEIRSFMDQHFTTTLDLPIVLRVESISASVCGHLVNLPQFDISSRIRGLGAKLIRDVDLHVGALSSLFHQGGYFTFNFENPLDAVLEIGKIELDVIMNGDRITSVNHIFGEGTSRFVIPPGEQARSPHVSLTPGFRKTLKLAMFPAEPAYVDVKVRSATMHIDQFVLQGLTYDLKGVAFKLHWSI